jgi:malate synthase
MDGAWTGHPDQNQMAVAQFPAPNQLRARRAHAERYPDLKPVPQELLPPTLNGTRAAVRTVIRYRNAVLNRKGCSLQEGCREDLGSDRMCRLMIAQRMRHSGRTDIVDDSGEPVEHSPELISELFDEQVEMLALNRTREDPGTSKSLREARRIAEDMVLNEEFDAI